MNKLYLDHRRLHGAAIGALACVIFVLVLRPALPATPAQSDLHAAVKRIVARDIAPMAAADGAGGVAVAVRIDGRTFFFNYGLADRAAKRPITSDSLFNVGSIRKIFEAVLITLGVERRELTLDDRVAQYVTELHGDYIRRVTIGQLATHTSGLIMPAEPEPLSPKGYPLAQFIDVLNNYRPENGEQPGKQQIYSHAGYVLLQLALERRYGRPIAELIRDRVTEPLGMDSTLVPERGPHHRAIMPREFMQRAVQGYSYGGQPIGLPGNQQDEFDFPGTGQMFSSPRDLAILAAAGVHDWPVDGEMWRALQATEQGVFRVSADDVQAMAWEVIDAGGPTIVDKPGGLDNAQAYIGLVPAQKLGLVILSNRGDIHPFEAARATVLPELARLK